LRNKLDYLHFTEQEKDDFLEYRLPEFKPWFKYSISFKLNEQFDPYATLEFKVQPDKIFRVFMEAHQIPVTRLTTFNRWNPDKDNETYLRQFDRWSEFEVFEWWWNLTKL
jgi:hypothetical protein